MAAPQSLTILGSTGSVGANTLDVVERSTPFACRLTANPERDALRSRPSESTAICGLSDPHARAKRATGPCGMPGRNEVPCESRRARNRATLTEVDNVMAAIVGREG